MTHVGYVQTAETKMRRAASRLGIPYEEYYKNRMNGLRWCSYHGRWEASWLFKRYEGKMRSYCCVGVRGQALLRTVTRRLPTPGKVQLVKDYAERILDLPHPHGPDHDCLVCADVRRVVGHRPMIPDYRDLFRVQFEV